MTMVTLRQFFTFGDRFIIFEMNILLIFFGLFRMAASTIHIDEALSEMHVGIGIEMAIQTTHINLMVNVLRPFLGIHEQRTGPAVVQDLEESGLAMAVKTILIGICLGKNKINTEEKYDDNECNGSFKAHEE